MGNQTDEALKATEALIADGIDQGEPACVSKCGLCNGSLCEPFRGKPKGYDGIRFTADGFDCSLQVAIDQYSTCSFNCLYCFSNFLSRDPHRKNTYKVGKWPIAALERLLERDREYEDPLQIYRKALWQKNPHTGEHMRVPVQWGALGDPFDNIERNQGWALEAARLFVKHDVPVRVSTKGGHLLLTQPEYLDALSHPNFWVACSLISIDDDVMLKVDRGTPPPSERLKMLAELSRRGVPTSLRFRPVIQGVSDATKKHPYAWRELIDRAAEAGVQSISMEYVFIPGVQPPHIKQRMNELDQAAGWQMAEFYRKSTARYGACLRSSRTWKQDITYAIYEHCQSVGMRFAISDPHFKELNATGSCCGLPDQPKDKHYDYFGGWSRYNATNAVVESRDAYLAGGEKRVSAPEYIPEWAWDHPMADMCLMTKPSQAMRIQRWSWGDKLQDTWNDVKSARGPLGYFEGVLRPVGMSEDRNVEYVYVPYERRDVQAETGWDLNEGYPGLANIPPIEIPKRWNRTHNTQLGAEVGNPGEVCGVGGCEPCDSCYKPNIERGRKLKPEWAKPAKKN